MTNIVDKLIDDLILEIGGREVVPLVNLIKNKTDVSEFKIAAKLDITVNQVRNILYRLNNHNLVDFTRQKDKTKGWYIYFWSFNMKLAKELALNLKNNKLALLRKRLEKESNETYYACPSECVRFDSTNSMEYQYKCPECGKILVREDNKKPIDKINKEIMHIEKDFTELREFEEKIAKAEARKIEKEKEAEKLRKLNQKKKLEKVKPKKVNLKKVKDNSKNVKVKKSKK